MGNIFKGCSNDDDIYKEINLKEEYIYHTQEGPPIFTDDTFTTYNSCIRCPKELC
jgi:hypothetical protein